MFIRLIIVIAFIITAGVAIPVFANPDIRVEHKKPASEVAVHSKFQDQVVLATKMTNNVNVTSEIGGDDNCK